MGQWENQCPETPWNESGSRVTKSLKSAHLLTLFKEAKAWIIPWTTVAKSQKRLSLSLSRRKNVTLTSVPCGSTDKHKNLEMTQVIAKQAMRHQYEGMAIDPLKMTSMWTVLIQVMWLILVRDCFLLRREFQTICLSEGKCILRICRYLGAPKSNKRDADLSKEWDLDPESHQGKTMPLNSDTNSLLHQT